MAILRAAVTGRLTSRSGDVPWPPRSTDLALPDLFLWGYLKEKLYINITNTLHGLKNNIIEEINRITPDIL